MDEVIEAFEELTGAVFEYLKDADSEAASQLQQLVKDNPPLKLIIEACQSWVEK